MLLFFNGSRRRDGHDVSTASTYEQCPLLFSVEVFRRSSSEDAAPFLNFKTTRSLIKFLSPGRRKIASQRPTILAVWIFFSDLSPSPAAGKKKERSRGRAGPRKEKWKEEEENGKKRVGPRAAGLMSLIMEKYIKWHPVYFLRSISRSDSARLLLPVFRSYSLRYSYFCVCLPRLPFFY